VKKYKTIVIDPPWMLSPMSTKLVNRDVVCVSSEMPYRVMSDIDLLAFPIQDFADDECDIFLWTTKAKIHFSFHLLDNWGFHYSNFFVWNKRDGLNNNGVHHTLEFVLYGYKQKSNLTFTKPIEQYFEAKRLKHSQKPDVFYATLAKVTKEPRIDIFARKRHFGFDAYGDQIENTMEMPLA
jgi:N6-adenosine-specific RNA methylase IME4